MFFKNFVLVLAAASAFAGAIFVAAGPEPQRVDFAMPMYKVPR